MKYLLILFVSANCYAMDISLHEVAEVSSLKETISVPKWANKEQINLYKIPVINSEEIIRADVKITVIPAITQDMITEALEKMNKDQRLALKDELKPTPEGIDNSITLILDNVASHHFKEYSGKNIGKPLAIVVNGRVFSMPVLRAKISDGLLRISGRFSEKKLKKIFLPTEKKYSI